MKPRVTKNVTGHQKKPAAKKNADARYTHGGLKSRLLLKLSELPGTMVVNAPTGMGLSPDGKRKIAFGKKGLADIIGICGGIGIAVEVKVGNDTLSEDQIKFRRNWLRCGGVFIEARDVDGTLADLRAGVARAELKMAERFEREHIDFDELPE